MTRTGERRTGQRKRASIRLRLEVLQGYGGRCACCGQTNAGVLALDHVVPVTPEQQSQRRRDPYLPYRDARVRRFPSDYQVLCFNCNWLKHTNSACNCQTVHETVDEALARVPRLPAAAGRSHPSEVVSRVRELLAEGVTQRAIARLLPVSQQAVSRISRGVTYV